MSLDAAVTWARRACGALAIGGIGLLFLPAERVPIPAEYGGSADGATVTAAADGPTLYAEHCSQCHGLAGEGGRGPSLEGTYASIGRDGIRGRIQRGGMQMPAFGTQLSRAEVEAVLDHLADV